MIGRVAHPKTQLEDALTEFFHELHIPEQEWGHSELDIAKTPHRVSKMLRDEMLASYKPGAHQALLDKFTCFPSDGKDALVLIGPTDFSSLCSHHMLPFIGSAYVGYVPGPKVVGASKIPRVVDYFARMLQIQERMTRQIADFIHEQAEAKAVICLIDSAHTCMRCRGVKQMNSRMVTTAIRPNPEGDFGGSVRGLVDEFYQQLAIIRK